MRALITNFSTCCVSSKMNSCLGTFGESLISAPFCLSRSVFFLPVFASLCVSEIYVLSKESSKKRFRSPHLKGINSPVSLLNCFKESVLTDAIIHEGWRNHLCTIELLCETLSKFKIRSVYKYVWVCGDSVSWSLRTDFITNIHLFVDMDLSFSREAVVWFSHCQLPWGFVAAVWHHNVYHRP